MRGVKMKSDAAIKVKDSKVKECRYSTHVISIFGEWDVIEDGSYNNYSGRISVLCKKRGKYAYIQFDYGSCRICDEWESRCLSFDEIAEEINDLALIFKSKDELELWLERKETQNES